MELYFLLQKAQSGNEESTINLFLKFHPAIKKLSRNLYYEEAETDLTIAFLEFIRNIDLNLFSNHSDGQVVNFICKFLKNKSVDLFRKHVLGFKPSVEVNDSLLYDHSIPSLDSEIFVYTLLSTLPQLQREVIIKKFIHSFTDREIAKLLGISRQAVNRAKNRGLKNLRKALEKDKIS